MVSVVTSPDVRLESAFDRSHKGLRSDWQILHVETAEPTLMLAMAIWKNAGHKRWHNLCPSGDNKRTTTIDGSLFQVSLLLSWKMKVPSSRPQPEEHDGRLERALHRNILGQETAFASSDTEDDGIWRKRSRISISRHRYTTTLLKSDILESWQPEYDLPKTTCRSTQWQRSSWQSDGKKQTSSFTVLYWHQSLEDSFSCFFHQVYGPGKRTRKQPKSTLFQSAPVRKVRWPISILAQCCRILVHLTGESTKWEANYSQRYLDELTSVPGRSPHDAIHSRKVPTSKAVERLFIIPRELAVPSGTTAMLGEHTSCLKRRVSE